MYNPAFLYFASIGMHGCPCGGAKVVILNVRDDGDQLVVHLDVAPRESGSETCDTFANIWQYLRQVGKSANKFSADVFDNILQVFFMPRVRLVLHEIQVEKGR